MALKRTEHTVSGHAADEYIKRVALEAGDLGGNLSEELDLLSDTDLLNRFSPNSNKAAEMAHERHNTNELALVNDPTTNSYAVERKTNMMFGYLDDPYEVLSGMSEAEAKQKKQEKELSDAIQAAMIDSQEEQFEQQKKQLQKLWDEGNVSVTVGGISMTSGQIDSILQMWADPEKKKQLIDDFSKKENISKEEAAKRLEEATRILAIIKMHERGEQLTPEQQDLYHWKKQGHSVLWHC